MSSSFHSHLETVIHLKDGSVKCAGTEVKLRCYERVVRDEQRVNKNHSTSVTLNDDDVLRVSCAMHKTNHVLARSAPSRMLLKLIVTGADDRRDLGLGHRRGQLEQHRQLNNQ